MCLGPNDLPTTAVAIATVVASKTGTYVCSVSDWVVHSMLVIAPEFRVLIARRYDLKQI